MAGTAVRDDDRLLPPSAWPNVDARPIAGTDEVLWGYAPEYGMVLWHWCAKYEFWYLSTAGLHTAVISNEGLLSLVPSVWWSECCGLHGWFTRSEWHPVP
jgi:hypothetical protein